ncbi:hypothetical protein ACH41H_25310, partial [Streptomyces sp. NPDC020800]
DKAADHYRLHLDEGHENADRWHECGRTHIEGLSRFIRQSDLFHLDLPQALEGSCSSSTRWHTDHVN